MSKLNASRGTDVSKGYCEEYESARCESERHAATAGYNRGNRGCVFSMKRVKSHSDVDDQLDAGASFGPSGKAGIQAEVGLRSDPTANYLDAGFHRHDGG